MSWLPTFEIGLWNAWILMLYFPLHPIIMFVVDKVLGTGDIFKKMGEAPLSKKEKKLYGIYLAIQLILLAYSVFLPLKLGTGWFYAGLAIYWIGLILLLTAIVNVAVTPFGRVFSRGIYRYTRHPMYLAGLIIPVGISVTSASWVFLLLAVVVWFVQVSQVNAEERFCLEMFGKEYQDYMNRTPRWIGMPKLR
jgi:protein-S-isoprenylcysteine O-methyltransferase Ste14